ncbi:MAG: 5-carboxymethyl-2-hydroxymuconate isomerase [Pseudomonadota bacterium]
MPHLRIDYTANLDPGAAMSGLCTTLAAAMAGMLDNAGAPLFPLHGTRVLAYPAPCHSVADGGPGNAFVYMNLRITPGRSADLVDRAGAALLDVVRAHFEPMALGSALSVTLHIDEVKASYEGRYRPA